MSSKKNPQKQIVTSLRVNSQLWKLAKIEAIKRDVTLADIVDESLRKELGLKKDRMNIE